MISEGTPFLASPYQHVSHVYHHDLLLFSSRVISSAHLHPCCRPFSPYRFKFVTVYCVVLPYLIPYPSSDGSSQTWDWGSREDLRPTEHGGQRWRLPHPLRKATRVSDLTCRTTVYERTKINRCGTLATVNTTVPSVSTLATFVIYRTFRRVQYDGILETDAAAKGIELKVYYGRWAIDNWLIDNCRATVSRRRPSRCAPRDS